jgi:hypothetical protein
MTQTLEQRMDLMESKLTVLAGELAKLPPARKDWRTTVGLSREDADFDGMIQLGRAYRQASNNGDDRAHS